MELETKIKTLKEIRKLRRSSLSEGDMSIMKILKKQIKEELRSIDSIKRLEILTKCKRGNK
jgi:ferritin